MEKWLERFVRLVTVFGMLALAGCGGGGSGEAPVADYGRTRAMGGFYEAYLSAQRGQPPANEQVFRDFLNTKQENLQKAGLTIDAMFVSPRNGKPLTWVYGKVLPKDPKSGITYFAYESEPEDGKRLVIGGRGVYEEMDEARFRSVFPNTP